MLTKDNQAQNSSLLVRLLVACGAVGPLLFLLVVLIEDVTRPGYVAWHQFVSELSLSDQGWIQIINFIVCGVLVLCFAVGLRLALRSGKGSIGGPLFLGLFALAIITAGIYVTDPSLGYPPDIHGKVPQTLHGTIHSLAGLAGFIALAVACFVMSRRFMRNPNWKGWALSSIVTGILVIGFFIASVTMSAFDASGRFPNAPVGLLESMAILIGWGWIALMALRLLRQMRPPVLPEHAHQGQKVG